jgi:hypothetical protein
MQNKPTLKQAIQIRQIIHKSNNPQRKSFRQSRREWAYHREWAYRRRAYRSQLRE